MATESWAAAALIDAKPAVFWSDRIDPPPPAAALTGDAAEHWLRTLDRFGVGFDS